MKLNMKTRSEYGRLVKEKNEMRIGVVYPQTEFGSDPHAIRDYAQTAEELGFTHVLAYDHVLGANPERPGGWKGPYTFKNPFQSPFLLFSFMAAATSQLEFTTGIVILPQRQTALVAKQAATLDVLSAGRLRLGIGIGWNAVEYESLGENFKDRGRRSEEQVNLMRQLWTNPLVNFSGRWHTIPDAGINPLPVQRPIPVWFGGNSEPVLRRTANMGDGWMPNYRSPDKAKPDLEKIEHYLEQAGRDRAKFGIEARISYGEGNITTLEQLVQSWESVGATHLSLNTMGFGFDTPGLHLDAIQKFASAFGLNQEM
jgi:probable F420-dependent oxidoreductase